MRVSDILFALEGLDLDMEIVIPDHLLKGYLIKIDLLSIVSWNREAVNGVEPGRRYVLLQPKTEDLYTHD